MYRLSGVRIGGKRSSNLYLADNSNIDETDKQCKVRILVDHLIQEFRKVSMTKHLRLDGQIVPYKGASRRKPYIPPKRAYVGV